MSTVMPAGESEYLWRLALKSLSRPSTVKWHGRKLKRYSWQSDNNWEGVDALTICMKRM